MKELQILESNLHLRECALTCAIKAKNKGEIIIALNRLNVYLKKYGDRMDALRNEIN
jgi:hypothetical protein